MYVYIMWFSYSVMLEQLVCLRGAILKEEYKQDGVSGCLLKELNRINHECFGLKSGDNSDCMREWWS